MSISICGIYLFRTAVGVNEEYFYIRNIQEDFILRNIFGKKPIPMYERIDSIALKKIYVKLRNDILSQINQKFFIQELDCDRRQVCMYYSGPTSAVPTAKQLLIENKTSDRYLKNGLLRLYGILADRRTNRWT